MLLDGITRYFAPAFISAGLIMSSAALTSWAAQAPAAAEEPPQEVAQIVAEKQIIEIQQKEILQRLQSIERRMSDGDPSN